MAEINIPQIEPNSYKYRAEKAAKELKPNNEPVKLTPVVSKKDLVLPKENFGTKLKGLFFSKTPSNLGETILKECIVPSVMKLVWDSIQISLFGKTTGNEWYRDERYRDYSRPYQNPYRNNDYSRSPYRTSPISTSGSVDYRNLILQRSSDAERVVHSLWDCIRHEGKVSIAQLLDLFDVVGEFTDNNWGWTDERDIGIRKIPQGFLIDLAEPKYIN